MPGIFHRIHRQVADGGSNSDTQKSAIASGGTKKAGGVTFGPATDIKEGRTMLSEQTHHLDESGRDRINSIDSGIGVEFKPEQHLSDSDISKPQPALYKCFETETATRSIPIRLQLQPSARESPIQQENPFRDRSASAAIRNGFTSAPTLRRESDPFVPRGPLGNSILKQPSVGRATTTKQANRDRSHSLFSTDSAFGSDHKMERNFGQTKFHERIEVKETSSSSSRGAAEAHRINGMTDKVRDLREKNRQLGANMSDLRRRWFEAETSPAPTFDAAAKSRQQAEEVNRRVDEIIREKTELEAKITRLEAELEQCRINLNRPNAPPTSPSSFSRYEDDLRRMEQDFERIRRSYGSPVGSSTANGVTFVDPKDPGNFHKFAMENPIVEEYGVKKYKLSFDVSKFRPEEVNINTTDQTLVIEAKHLSKGPHREEAYEFRRELTLPEGVIAEELRCTYKPDGFLYIDAPYHEPMPAVCSPKRETVIPIRRGPTPTSAYYQTPPPPPPPTATRRHQQPLATNSPKIQSWV